MILRRVLGRPGVLAAVARSVPPHGARCLSSGSGEALAAKVAAADSETQEAVLAALSAETKKQASLKWMVEELEEEFARADINTDGTLSYKEFQQWAREVIERTNSPGALTGLDPMTSGLRRSPGAPNRSCPSL